MEDNEKATKEFEPSIGHSVVKLVLGVALGYLATAMADKLVDEFGRRKHQKAVASTDEN